MVNSSLFHNHPVSPVKGLPFMTHVGQTLRPRRPMISLRDGLHLGRKQFRLKMTSTSEKVEFYSVKERVETTDSSSNNLCGRFLDYGPFRYLFAFTLPASCLFSIYSNKLVTLLQLFISISPTWTSILSRVLSFSGVIFPFVILPLMDLYFGRDQKDPPEEAISDIRYRWMLYMYVPVHVVLIFAACSQASRLLTDPIAFIGVVMSLGTLGGLGFTVAHELIHGNKKIEDFLVNILLCLFCYMHYSMSHLAHHIKVGTMDDAGTGHLNESIYQFLPRAIYMSIRDGLWMEKRRLVSRNLTVVSPQSRLWFWLFSPIVLGSIVYSLYGSSGLSIFCIQAFLSIIMLEDVNYIEHYGLTRGTKNGKLVPVNDQHSWNADWVCTSSLVFQLQRHSHHHIQSSMHYQGLKSIPGSPLLPMSYPGIMMLSLIPPLFFRIMNPLVQQQLEVRST